MILNKLTRVTNEIVKLKVCHALCESINEKYVMHFRDKNYINKNANCMMRNLD